MDESRVPAEWYKRFITHAVNNLLNRDGDLRFTYKQLRSGLSGNDEAVKALVANIRSVLPAQGLSDRQIMTLSQALVCVHMGFHLVNPDLIEFVGEEVLND